MTGTRARLLDSGVGGGLNVGISFQPVDSFIVASCRTPSANCRLEGSTEYIFYCQIVILICCCMCDTLNRLPSVTDSNAGSGFHTYLVKEYEVYFCSLKCDTESKYSRLLLEGFTSSSNK